MFGNVQNHVSGLGTSLGSWFKKDKEQEGAEPEKEDGSKPEEATPPAVDTEEKTSKSKKSADDNADAVSNRSGGERTSEETPDRFDIEEERADGAEVLKPSLGANWGKYFVSVGDWMVRSTESADSQPTSDHEDDEAKAGFASGLASMNLSDMSSRASASAKSVGSSVGSFFGSAFSKASQSVKDAGSKIKESVEKNPLLTEFNKEQEAFLKEAGGRKAGEALPPWVGYPQEDRLKEEILGLATERKNFVRNPTEGVHFEFELEQFLPVAQATLAADPQLQDMRFQLVPKVVSEEVFWRNYFYRVGLLRQSVQMEGHESGAGEQTEQAEG